MRLHRLTVSAFGPFAADVEVDVDAVSAGGLFLIRGATGAGKTSLLDAICFALYADVPGARSKKGLHSHHASPDKPPRVELEFTAAGRRLRIERAPEFVRPAKRSGGRPVTVPAKAALFERTTAGWRELSARHDEIADVLRDVLGMGLAQFSKVVLLPQGDFAAFLRATPEERRGLLERLFDISAFTGVEDWLAERRRRSSADLTAARSAIGSDVGRLADALSDAPAFLADALPDWAAVEPSDMPAVLEQVRSALESAAAQTLAELDATSGAERDAVARHADGRRVAAARTKASSARAALSALEAGRGDHVSALTAVDAAARAASVSGELKALARAEVAVQQATAAVDSSKAAVATFGLDDRGVEGVAAWIERLAAQDATLGDAERAAVAVAGREARRAELATAIERQDEGQRAAAHRVAAGQQALARAQNASAAAASAAARVPARAAEVDRLSGLLRTRVEQDHGVLERERVAQRWTRARSAEQDARQRLLDLREARLDGMAGELAESLGPGSPCPVCGSCEHPGPAERKVPVMPEDIAAAEQAWSEAGAVLGDLERRISALDAAAAERERALGGEARTAAALESVLEGARARLAEDRRLAAAADRSEAMLASAAAEVEAATVEVAAVRDALVTMQATLDELQAASERDEERLGAALREHAALCPCADTGDRPEPGEPDVLAAAFARHRAAARLAGMHLDALRQRAGAEAGALDARAATAAALDDQGFATAAEARAALLDADAVTALRRRCAEYERAVTAAETLLADPEVLAAEQEAPPDLAALAHAESLARQALMAAKDAETLTRRALRDLDRIAPGLADRCSTLGPALAQHAVLEELADAVGGTGSSNTRRMRLSAFVLAARLEKVAELANERLATMGDGRYRLRHTDSLAARGARSGLGLEVQDLWTGQTRDTSSLSGGESFIASLALALGLADAVREESGGFDLQTLFVDEGFGTLDDETLEQVMAVLDGLREGGRAVGVVSHVGELRTRIPNQVVVHKTGHGSTLRVTTADDSAPAA